MRYPLALPLAAFIGGITLALAKPLQTPPVVGFVAAGVLAAGALVSVGAGRPRAARVLLLAGAACYAWSDTLRREFWREPGNLAALTSQFTDQQVTIEGIVSLEREVRSSYTLRLQLASQTLTTPKGFVLPAKGGLVAYLGFRDGRKEPRLVAGQKVRVKGTLRPFRPATEDSPLDISAYWHHKGFEATLSTNNPANLTFPERPPGGIRASLGRLRLAMERMIREGPTFGEPVFPWQKSNGWDRAKSLALALTTGQTDFIPREQFQDFRLSGFFHVLTISGFKIGIISVGLFWVFWSLRLPPVVVRILTCGGITLYGLLTGLQAPTLRALLVALLYLGGKILGRGTSLLNSLVVAALILLIWSPALVEEVSFQMTFAGTAGLGLFIVPIMKDLPSIRWEWLRGMVAASLAATVGILPFLVTSFQQVPLLTMMLAIPHYPVLFALQMSLLGLLGCTAAGWQVLVGPLREMVLWLAGRLDAWVAFCAKVPLVCAYCPPLSAWLFVWFWGFWGLWLASRNREKGLAWYRGGMAVMALGCAGVWLAGEWAVRPSGKAECHVIDVGEGDAILLREPDGRAWLVDAGFRQENVDKGDWPIRSYLLKKGIRRLEGGIFTHQDRDHSGGFMSLIREFPIKQLIGLVPPEKNPFLEYLLAEARRRRIPLWLFPENHALKLSSNENVLVATYLWGNFQVLLTADMTKSTEGALARWGDGLRSTVLKVAHHGGKGSTSEAFVQEVHPQLAVISCGQFNRFGHPNPEILETLTCLLDGSNLFRTDRQGSIEMRSDGENTLQVSCLKSEAGK